MPGPAPIKTDKRDATLNAVWDKIDKLAKKIDAAVTDLAKPHVDDRAAAKKLLARAKKMAKGLQAALAA